MVRLFSTCAALAPFLNHRSAVGYIWIHTIVTFSDCSTSPRRELENNLRMSEIEIENELIAAGQDEETAFYKVLLPISIIMPHYH